MESLIWVLLVGLVAFQIWVTVKVFRNGLYERSQKLLQTQLIWFLPVLGAILVFMVMRDEEQHERQRTKTQISAPKNSR